MHGLIAALILVFCTNALAEKWPTWPQIQPVRESLGWVINKQNIVGHPNRVNLFIGQDPFPFCAAVSASILHDQHECMTAKRDCRQQPRTSFLSLVPASQDTPGKINWDKGGNSLLALRKIVKDGGGAAHDSCNYDDITNPRKNKGTEFVRLYSNYTGYKQFSQWRGYMARYYRDELLLHITDLGLQREGLTLLLDRKFDNPHDLVYGIMFTDSCNQISIESSKPYTIKKIEGQIQDIALSYTTIKNLLSNNVPVGINLCLNVEVGFKTCSKHSLVIFAQSTASNKITGDTRRVYQIANTWGEKWTFDNSDGWVFADQLYLGIYDIFWLD